MNARLYRFWDLASRKRRLHQARPYAGLPVARRRVGATALLAASALMVGSITTFVTVTSVEPDLTDGFSALLVSASGPQASGTILALVAALVALFVAFWLPRRHLDREFTFAAGMTLSALTFLTAVPTYIAHGGEEAAFWSPVAWTLALFVGNVQDPDGSQATALPLALQVARLFAISTTFLGITAALARAFRDQSDRLRARRARSVILVVGLDDLTVPFIRQLLRERSPGTTVVVLERDRANPAVRELRHAGARVVFGSADDDETVRELLVRRRVSHRGRASCLRAAYLLQANATEVLAAAEVVMAQTERLRTDGTLPRLVARLDSPWQAEAWRRSQIALADEGRIRFLTDTIGQFQVVAQQIVDHVLSTGRSRLILVGGTALTLAVLDELAQHYREQAVRRTPAPLDVVIVGQSAHRVLADHAFHQAYYGHSTEHATMKAVTSPPEPDTLDELVEGGARPVVVVALPPSAGSDEVGVRTAAHHATAEVLTWTTGVSGVSDRLLVADTRPFGPTLLGEHDGSVCLPEPVWGRIARRLHERYVETRGGKAVESPSQGPWRELSDFYRESNLRRLAVALEIAVRAGRTWTRPAAANAATQQLTTDEIRRWAYVEHESWRSYYEANGWRYGPARRENHAWNLRHDLLVPWSELDEEHASYTAASVGEALAYLAAIGYRPFLDPRVWTAYSRTGQVTAHHVDEQWSWTTAAGDTMTAEAGDWLIVDDQDIWSITYEALHRTYRHVEGDRWERIGQVWARAALPGETVSTAEGRATALTGHRVVRDEAGNEWLVPTDRFASSYVELKGDAG